PGLGRGGGGKADGARRNDGARRRARKDSVAPPRRACLGGAAPRPPRRRQRAISPLSPGPRLGSTAAPLLLPDPIHHTTGLRSIPLTAKSTEMPYANPDSLVSTEWLAARLTAPDIRVVDASFKLPGVTPTAAEDYALQHIPGAVFFDIDEISDTS